MVRAMYDQDRVSERSERNAYNFFDINIVAISGRVVKEPRLRQTYNEEKGTSRDVLDVKIAYRKGDKSCYIDCIVISAVDAAARSIKRGSYVFFQGFLNERVYKTETGDSEWTELNLIVDKWNHVPAFGPTMPEIYDLAEGYDE
jgi:hypothetical protein